MPLIDQRILIDAPTETVWSLLSDPNKLPRWHAGCTGISVLTTLPTGVGARWRCSLASGKDVIQQITAWVDGLGYEYSILEGGSARSYQSRFRLQPGPDGTSVQWTITYQPKGILGWIRDRFKGRRETALMMATSLRQLKREVDAMGVRLDEEARARFLIRERLSADQRAQYNPRFARPVEAEIAVGSLPGAMAAPAEVEPVQTPEPDEPPVADPSAPSFVNEIVREEAADEVTEADTKPKPPAGLKAALSPAGDAASSPSPFARPAAPAPVPPSEEDVPLSERLTPPEGTPIITPDMLSSGSEDITDDSLLIVRPPEDRAPAPLVKPQPPAKPAPETPLPAPPVEALKPPPPAAPPVAPPTDPTKTPPHGTPAVGTPRSDLPKTGPLRRTPPTAMPPVGSTPRPVPESEPGSSRATLPPPTSKYDTGEVTIWEVFGIQRPSDADAAALDELIQTVHSRERAALWAKGHSKRPAHVRMLSTVLGLRVRLALERALVRFGHLPTAAGGANGQPEED
ncbi:MAG TPA: SRPBCC family protein [Aggregatilinea sp.]|uniref:SRPBCC family protein n=1 Tax=Aggregatilinea sp. TaxID=2806333 RepID=UPI002C75F0A4|nr:SRPBCC family protein [Aggregatilinea sp.]HML23615.1 SRPBCC family protein [Aggregatilinea sp.]